MRFRKIIKIIFKYYLFIVPMIMFFSCNVTKRVKDNEKLLAKNSIVIEKGTIKSKDLGFGKYEINQIILPKPNSKFLSIPIRLWIYQFYTEEQIKKKELRKQISCESKNTKKISSLNIRIRQLEKKRNLYPKQNKKYKNYTKKIARKEKKKKKFEYKDCYSKHWTREIGENPILLSSNDTLKNRKKIELYLKNKGYYSANIKINTKRYRNFFQEIFLPAPTFICENKALRNLPFFPGKVFLSSICNISNGSKNKIKVEYDITTYKAHKINNIDFNISNKKIKEIVLLNKKKSFIKKGNRLDFYNIENERKRIYKVLKNAGYYSFSKDYIFFTVDTISKKELADIVVNISSPVNKDKETVFKKHIIKNVFIYPNFKSNDALANKLNYYKNQDTLIYYSKNRRKYNLIYNNAPRVNKKAIVSGIDVSSGDLYDLKKIKQSYRYLTSLPIIQTANITFIKLPKDSLLSDSFDYLNCEIKLSQDKLHANEFGFEFTNTNRNLGVGGRYNYTHKNFFKRAEVFNFNVNAEFKRIVKNNSTFVANQLFNSQEYGLGFSIKFPRLFIPHFIRRFFIRSNPFSKISVRYDYTNRPDYRWSILGTTLGYNWNSTKKIFHYFVPLTADYLYKETALEYILNNRNYDDRFILGSSYKFTFNNYVGKRQKKQFLIFIYTKFAGNVMNTTYGIFNKQKDETGRYSVFGNPFAQFVKAYLDIRYYRRLNSLNDKLAMRLFSGFALPYGNLNVIPFNEQFSVGGSTGIRAWDERSLGPGSYVINDDNIPYFYQKSDIKLEANIEYRKKISNKWETALFIDAGNIWAINKEDKREGALFEFNDFYKEIAIGTGFGIRYDLTLIILRADLGMKLRNPALPVNNRWLNSKDFFSFKNLNFNLGIGYSF